MDAERPETGARADVEARLAAAPRLGLFGGTFDPVHRGHLHVARTALEAARLDLVVFVPAARSPHKDGGAAATGEERLAMLGLATAGEPRFAVWDAELRRGAPSYTADTVRELVRMRRRGGRGAEGLFLVLGSDNLAGLASWSRVGEVLEDVRPVVVERRGAPVGVIDSLGAAGGLSPAELELLRRGFVSGEPVDVSATALREDLRAGRGAGDVPAAVWEYLTERGIYRR